MENVFKELDIKVLGKDGNKYIISRAFSITESLKGVLEINGNRCKLVSNVTYKDPIVDFVITENPIACKVERISPLHYRFTKELERDNLKDSINSITIQMAKILTGIVIDMLLEGSFNFDCEFLGE